MTVHALVVSVVQVITVHVVSPVQQGFLVVQKYQVRDELCLLLFISWSVVIFYNILDPSAVLCQYNHSSCLQ